MKKIMTLLFLMSFNTYADECRKVKIKIIFDKKPVVTKEVICTKKSSDNMIFYVSKSCAENNCEILKRKKSFIQIKDYTSNIGSPGFKLCSELGGVPQIFEFSKGSDVWENTDRCLFGRDDFVEISWLVREWKEFIQKM